MTNITKSGWHGLGHCGVGGTTGGGGGVQVKSVVAGAGAWGTMLLGVNAGELFDNHLLFD
jgi:hypothetical protein